MSFLHPVARRVRAISAVVCSFSALALACASSSEQIRGADPTLPDASAADGGSGRADGSASKPKPTATADSACADYAEARCKREKSCNAFFFAAQWGTEPECEERMSIGCADRFSAHGTTWKPDNLAECAVELGDASCDDLQLGILPSSCQASPGTLGKGTACAYDDQCETGFCKKGSTGGCGSCKEHAKEGGSCSQDTDCTPGLACVSYSCRALGRIGDDCGGSKLCMFGLVCDGGTCSAGAPAGSPCGQEPGLPDPCDQANGVFCDALLMSCRKVEVVPTGSDCSPYSPSLCAAGGYCNGYECVPALQEGDSCQVTGNRKCQFPAVCDLGKCSVLTAADCG